MMSDFGVIFDPHFPLKSDFYLPMSDFFKSEILYTRFLVGFNLVKEYNLISV